MVYPSGGEVVVYSGENVMTNWERKWLNWETGMAKGGDMVAK